MNHMLDSQQYLANYNFGSHISEGAYREWSKTYEILGSRVRVPLRGFSLGKEKIWKSQHQL